MQKLGKPVLFRQTRPGQYGEPFEIYKFRTMSDKRDENGELLPDDQRMTSVGTFIRKSSIDELPQLINVLKGDISLIGPRPLLMEYLPLYNDEQKSDIMLNQELQAGLKSMDVMQLLGMQSLN